MLFFPVLLTVFLLAVFYYDLTRYLIPNWLVGVIFALYPAMLMLSTELPEDFSIWWSLGIFAATFAIGFIFFALRWMGGGDVKLMTVLALWSGKEAGLEFLVYTAALGGVLALLLMLGRPMVARFAHTTNPEDLPRVLRHREPLPYGLAISIGFLIVLWLGMVPGLPVS